MEAWYQSLRPPKWHRHHASALALRICLKEQPTRLNRDIQHPADLTFSVPPSHCIKVRNINRFPSATHFCLTLGADSPCADERCAGNLGLSARELFTPFIATHVSIRTSDTSSKAHPSPSQAYRTLSYHMLSTYPQLRYHSLSPVTSSAQDDSTSELLRFL